MNSEPDALGSTEPRVWTPPLRPLTRATSYGFCVIDFADLVLHEPLDPWQAWLVVHAGELLPDGRPRFRQVLALVARQQGKTHLLKVLALFWIFIERQRLVLGMSTNLDYAREAWLGAVDVAENNEWLAPEVGRIRRANGEQALTTTDRCRYKIAASNRKGGRSLTINRLVIDELREHDTWEAHSAAVPATNAVFDAQIWYITNQGDDKSVVLDSIRGSAIEFVLTGIGDQRLGIFEWSAEDGARPDSLAALARANPNLGRTRAGAAGPATDPYALLADARRAVAAGGEQLAKFRTEILCQRVHLLDPAIDPDEWAACGRDPGGEDGELADLAEHRKSVALCLDVSLEGDHASLVAAAVVDGVVHTDVVAAWAGHGCTAAVIADLPELVARVRPAVFAWLPTGPAAALAASMKERKSGPVAQRWPPRGVKLEEIRGEVTAVCMGLAEQVRTAAMVHGNDPMLLLHVMASSKQWRGDAWVFERRGASPIDGTYALAGALHQARTLRPRPPLTALR